MQNAAPPVTIVILRPLRLFTKPARMEKKAPAVNSWICQRGGLLRTECIGSVI